MPGGKQKAITLSFSRKNEDIFNLLEDKKKDKGFNQNDYICEAIRFYEENKDKIASNLDEYRIKELIDKKIEELKKELMNGDISIDLNAKEEFDDKKLEENLNFDMSILEDD